MNKVAIALVICICLISCKSKESKDISNYLLSYYDEQTKIKPDSVRYSLRTFTEKERIEYQAKLYKVEQIMWSLTDYSKDFKDNKKDEYKWKEDSCTSMISGSDSITTKYYKGDAYFFIKNRIDTIEEFFLNKSMKILPVLEFFDVPVQVKKAVQESKELFF